MKYTIEDEFDVSAQRYWEVFFDPEFNKAQWAYLNIEHEPLEFEKTGEGDDLKIVRVQRLTPHREVPAIIAKFVKGAITYTERNEFTARTNSMKTVSKSNFMADKIDNHGIYRLEVLGPKRVKRVWEGECNVNIPLVGGKIEKILVDEVRESYRKATEITRKWHQEHPE